MTTNVDFVFFLIAVIAFVLATFQVVLGRVQLIALGLVFFALPFLIAAWPGQ
jgi:hypothetical protein